MFLYLYLKNNSLTCINTTKVIGLKTLGFFHLNIKKDWFVLAKKFKHYVTDKVLPYAL